MSVSASPLDASRVRPPGADGAAGSASRPRLARPPLLTLNDALWWLYLHPVRWLSARVPRAALYGLGRVAEIFVQRRARRWKARLAERMLATRSGITPEEAPRIARQIVRSSVYQRLDDLLLSHPTSPAFLRCLDIVGLDHLERAEAAGHGVLVVSGHFFASHVANRFLATKGHPMLGVRVPTTGYARAGRLGHRIVAPQLDRFLHEVIRDEVSVVDRHCTLRILQRLRAGGLVNIHLEAQQGTRPVQARLLGVPLRFSGGILDIVRLSRCAVVPLSCQGRSTGFRIVLGEPLDVVSAPTRERFVNANLPTLLRVLERRILEHPEEWTLWHQM